MAIANSCPQGQFIVICFANYLLAASIATATATVIPNMELLPAPDNRRIASLQARLQASLLRLLHERCVQRNKVRSTKHQAKRRGIASKEYKPIIFYVNKPYEEAFSLNVLVLNTSHRCVLAHIIESLEQKVKNFLSTFYHLFNNFVSSLHQL